MAGLAVAAALLCAPAAAQETKGEISGNLGWTFSDGVTGASFLAGDGNIYNEIGPKDSFSWGLTAGYFFSEHWQFEFQFDQQVSKLEAKGTATTEVGDFKVHTYHGVFSYHGGDPDAEMRPFIFFGGGVTSYPGVDFVRFNGDPGEIGGDTQFSGTLGAGVKYYPGSRVGLRLQARWTPTYIKSDSEGYWCDPYWGCYVVGDAQYSNQFEFTGGISVRF
jgi:outer membrane protein W